MDTIALRFGEHFAPECGTVVAHQKIIDKLGYCWYGKIGAKVSVKLLNEVLKQERPRFLLINSGKAMRYWVYFTAFSNERPNDGEYPSYYGDKANEMKTWFKVISIETAPRDIMSNCVVISSGAKLGNASMHSMSPYFKIRYDGEES